MSVILEPVTVTLTEMTPYPYCAAAPIALTGPEDPVEAALGVVVDVADEAAPDDEPPEVDFPLAVLFEDEPFVPPPVAVLFDDAGGAEDAEGAEVEPSAPASEPDVVFEWKVRTPARPATVAPMTAG